MRRSLALLAVTALLSVGAAPVHAASHGSTTRAVKIPGEGGDLLTALVITPTGRGNGPFPLLVMPSSWSVNDLEYALIGAKLATERGYEVISYTTRGFWDSEGEIDIAGPSDVADARKIIDWALANTPARAGEIGMGGISYGAGISLLAAARDSRVRAVAALSGWADLRASLYPNQTLNEQSSALLLGAGDITGRPGADMKTLQNAYLNDDIPPVLHLADPRGAATYVKQLNANRPAVMLASGWADGIFPTGELAAFYNRLTTPKRLMLQAGDHATAEGLGAAGLPNDVWTDVGAWFDHYLRGADNGVNRQKPVRLKAGNGGSWVSVSSLTASHQARYYLGTGETTGTKAATGRIRRIATGKGTVADSGVVEVSGIAQQAGIPWNIRLSQIDRGSGMVWTTPALKSATALSGAPVLRTAVTSSARNVSLFAYVYDVAPGGKASLVTYEPYTLRGVTPGRAQALTLPLEPIRWNLARGHRIALVVDTMDVRYRSASRTGGTLAFTSPKGAPASLTLPTTG